MGEHSLSVFALFLIVVYFAVLILISFLTGKKDSNEVFFKAEKKSPWYLVAFGMIGASLSGITFISVPGWVEDASFSYMQMALGYILGYLIVGVILLPLYYKLNLTSIYTYLDRRFGNVSYKTGAVFFLVSRTIGASFRLFLVSNVLQIVIFDALGVPYWSTVTLTIALIWLYTFRSGIKTVIWTDTLQTFFMIAAVGVCIYMIYTQLDLQGSSLLDTMVHSKMSKIFFFEDYKSSHYFWKQFFSGAFMVVVMTGLDQDMMQKNLTCKSLKEAQKNMFWFAIVLTIVNFFFLCLGLLLTLYAQQTGINAHADDLFPKVALEGGLGIVVISFFILGLVAAAYSSADSALTSLTTSFCIDILNIEKRADEAQRIKIRKNTHIVFSLVLIVTIIAFKYIISNPTVISALFKAAGYTYGPLLGLYAFGLFTKLNVYDKWVPLIAILSPLLSWIVHENSIKWFDFDFGFFILIVNGLIMFLGLCLIYKKAPAQK